MKIARVFFDVDMRCNFEGIRHHVKKDMDNDQLSKDTVIILLNAAQTKFKLLIDNTYIVYYSNGNRRIPWMRCNFCRSALVGRKWNSIEPLRNRFARN